ncbi:MAG: flagellar biosynthetic protein FliO, partial [Gammaproteobacteria bacterium]|nr:flagellar biosynthetic protein FliO [Gammaproteobacteria bacterium]
VVLLIVFMAWMLKRINGFSTSMSGELKVIAGLNLGQREKIVLLKVGDKQLLVGVTPHTISTLHVLDESIQVSESDTTGYQLFATKLKNAMNKERNKS